MQEYKIILTWEAIYDVTDIADYIEEEFGQQRADRFQSDLKEQMQNLGQFSTAFPRTQILYRGYSIHKRSFPPSLVDMGITPHTPTQNRTCAINAYGFSLYIHTTCRTGLP